MGKLQFKSAMTKLTWFSVFFVLTSSTSLAVRAQFINFNITVEPELSTTVEQRLDFGYLVSNSGTKYIGTGDLDIGIFSIKAFYTQSIYVELISDDYLFPIDPSIPERIPLDLLISYNNSGVNNSINSIELINNQGFIPITSKSNSIRNTNANEIWAQLYLYIYGSIEVGDIPNGEYSTEILLLIDYN